MRGVSGKCKFFAVFSKIKGVETYLTLSECISHHYIGFYIKQYIIRTSLKFGVCYSGLLGNLYAPWVILKSYSSFKDR